MSASVSSVSNPVILTPPKNKYKKAIKPCLIATISIIGTIIFSALAASCFILAGIVVSAGTIDGCITALSSAAFGVLSAQAAYILARKANKYCRITHNTLNP